MAFMYENNILITIYCQVCRWFLCSSFHCVIGSTCDVCYDAGLLLIICLLKMSTAMDSVTWRYVSFSA